MKRTKEIFFLLIILAIAVFFRFWQLADIPPGLYHDVAMNGNDALDALNSGDFKVFYPENNGREGLFINLIALSFLIFGPSILAIKIVPAIIGTLTILGFYFLVKTLFNKIPLALISTFFLATSFWHVNFSRLGFRAIMVPFALVFCFYFLLRGLRKNSLFDFIISGAFFGLGFHTYISFRMAVLILAVPIIFILQKFWRDYKKSGKFWETYLLKNECWKFDVWLMVIFLVALPIGIYFLNHPQDFISRASGVSIFAQENIVKSFFESLIKHLGMFNFYGDPNWRHNFAGSPMLPFLMGILFIIGFAISIIKIVKSLRQKNWALEFSYWLIVVWFFAMLLPGILTAEGLPHSLRTIGVIPAVYIIAGIGGFWVFEKLKLLVRNRLLLFAFCFLFLFFVGYSEGDKYFIDWGGHPEVEGAFSKDYVDVGNYLNSLPPDVQKYVIVNASGVPVPWPDGIPMPAQTPMFIERTVYGQPRATYIEEKNLENIKPVQNAIFIPMEFDKELFDKLKGLYPEGKAKNEEGIWVMILSKNYKVEPQ